MEIAYTYITGWYVTTDVSVQYEDTIDDDTEWDTVRFTAIST